MGTKWVLFTDRAQSAADSVGRAPDVAALNAKIFFTKCGPFSKGSTYEGKIDGPFSITGVVDQNRDAIKRDYSVSNGTAIVFDIDGILFCWFWGIFQFRCAYILMNRISRTSKAFELQKNTFIEN